MTDSAHKTVDLPQGQVRYRESGDGEPIVFVHGLLVDGRLWDGVTERLSGEFRCIQPDWPMGSHTVAMNEGADLTPVGMARVVADFLAGLDLEGATIVGNDSGGAVSQLLATRHPERIGRLVLTNCDAFDKFPPFPFNLMAPISRLPGGMTMLQIPFRLGAARRLAFAPLAGKKIDPELVDSWMEPSMSDAAIARDTQKFIAGADKKLTLEAAERLPDFDRPALIAWGEGDRFFPLSYAERLAEAIPDSRLVKIPGGKTFVSLDRPEAVADAIASFMRDTAVASAAATG